MEYLKGSKTVRIRGGGRSKQQKAAEATLKMMQAWLEEKFIPHYAN